MFVNGKNLVDLYTLDPSSIYSWFLKPLSVFMLSHVTLSMYLAFVKKDCRTVARRSTCVKKKVFE